MKQIKLGEVNKLYLILLGINVVIIFFDNIYIFFLVVNYSMIITLVTPIILGIITIIWLSNKKLRPKTLEYLSYFLGYFLLNVVLFYVYTIIINPNFWEII
jgi:hypothetical protein